MQYFETACAVDAPTLQHAKAANFDHTAVNVYKLNIQTLPSSTSTDLMVGGNFYSCLFHSSTVDAMVKEIMKMVSHLPKLY